MRVRFNGRYGDIQNGMGSGEVGTMFLNKQAPFSSDQGMQSLEDTPGNMERRPPSENEEDDGNGPMITDRSFLVGHGSPALSHKLSMEYIRYKLSSGLGAPGQEMGYEGMGAGMGQLPNALQDLPNDAADLDSGPEGDMHPQSTHDLSGAQQGTQYVPGTDIDGWYSA